MQYFVFVMTRIIVPLYGMIFPILLLSVVIAIVSVAAEEKVCTVNMYIILYIYIVPYIVIIPMIILSVLSQMLCKLNA